LVAAVLVLLPWLPCQQAFAAPPAGDDPVLVAGDPDCGHCPDANDTPEHCKDIDKKPGEGRSPALDGVVPPFSVQHVVVPAPARAASIRVAHIDAPPPLQRLHLLKVVLLI
jgi:hypothetical protein